MNPLADWIRLLLLPSVIRGAILDYQADMIANNVAGLFMMRESGTIATYEFINAIRMYAHANGIQLEDLFP